MEVTKDGGLLPVSRIGEIEPRSADQAWLIEDLWLAQAAGIIGGQPKLWKSWFCLDAAVSIASGTKCLGRFAIRETGPTMVYMAEDDPPDVRRRVDGICQSRGLDVRELDLNLITSSRLYLDDDADRAQLRRSIEKYRPKLLVLDPLVRLHRGNENDSRDVAALLGFLRELQRDYASAIILAHHASKRSVGRPGQGLRGSSDLHAFGSSNLYLSHHGDAVQVDVEHRFAASTGPYLVRLVDEGGTHLELTDAAATKEPSLEERILVHLEDEDVPVPRAELRRALRVNNDRLGKSLGVLLRGGQIIATQGGVTLS